MSSFFSRPSLSTMLAPPLRVPVRKLSRYSWLFDIVRLKGSITGRIIGPVLTVTAFAAIVAVYDLIYGYNLKLTNNVVPLLSVVVGLILVFRNGTSYDRWYEGSKDFETTISHARNLCRLIWINVDAPPQKDTQDDEAYISIRERLRADKVRALRLIAAYLYSLMHHLREEPGLHYEDYLGLIPADFVRYEETFTDSPGSGTPTGYNSMANSGQESPVNFLNRPKTSNVHVPYPVHPHMPLLREQSQYHSVNFSPRAGTGSLPLPLIIAHELTRLIYKWKKGGCLDGVGPAGMNGLNTQVQGMVVQLAKMERVSNTPIPAAYGIHLKQCVTLYLFTLPFTLVSDLGWFMVPIVTVVAFTLMGIEGIADEIENPFGTDYYDLPLEQLCGECKAEIEYMMKRLPEAVDDFE